LVVSGRRIAFFQVRLCRLPTLLNSCLPTPYASAL
jgi:hypothetical protein